MLFDLSPTAEHRECTPGDTAAVQPWQAETKDHGRVARFALRPGGAQGSGHGEQRGTPVPAGVITQLPQEHMVFLVVLQRPSKVLAARTPMSLAFVAPRGPIGHALRGTWPM